MPWAETGRICMYYESAGTGTPATLLVHELGGNSRSFAQVQPALAAHAAVYAVDLRGYGHSEKPPGRRAIEDYADDLAAFVTTLRLAPVDVVGIAMGGVIVSSLAIRRPDCVRRLVLCEATDGMTEDARRYNIERAQRIRASGMRVAAEMSLKNSFPEMHARAREAYLPTYLANDPFAYAEASEALARWTPAPDDFARIRAPTLVISGRHDFIWPPETGRRAAALIPGARFHVIESAGHFPHLQTPDEFVTVTRDFLAD